MIRRSSGRIRKEGVIMLLIVLLLIGIGGAVLTCTHAELSGWVGIPLALGYMLAATLVFLILVALMSLFIRTDRPADRKTRFFRWVVNNVLGVMMVFMRVRVEVTGREKIPTDGRFLLVCNHRTIFDPVLTMVALRKFQISFISKKENYKIPVVGKLMHTCFCLPLDRESPREAVKTINEAAELLESDVVSIGIYPEGGTNRTEEPLLSFKNGAFKIAQKAKVPIVVTTIRNTERILKNAPWHSTVVRLKVLDVVPAERVLECQTKELSEEIWPMMDADLRLPVPEDLAK